MATKQERISKKASIQHDTATTPIYMWLIPPILLTTLGILFYYWSLNYAFQFDDLANITKFFGIRHTTFRGIFFYHSRWISQWFNALNFHMGSFEPFYYRLFNVLFHIITSVCAFLFLYLGLQHLKKESFFKKHAFPLAFLTAILFLLHPAQTQTVSYVIQGRLEGLVGLFVTMLALCFLLYSYAKTTTSRIILGTLFFVLAAFSCGTKEISIVSPALILITDWFFVSQGNWQIFKKKWPFHVSLFLLVGCLYIYYLQTQFFINLFGLKIEYISNIGNTITENRTDKILPLHYFISEFKVILHYLGIFLWPFNISVDYDWKMVQHFFAPDCFLPFIALLLIFTFLAYLFRKNNGNLIIFGMLWFFISMAPRTTIMPSTELIADYKTYLSSLGWLFVIACGIVYLMEAVLAPTFLYAWYNHTTGQYVALCLLALPIGYATYERNKVWRSAEEFWGNILQNAPNRARAHNNYGVALSEQGKYKESIPFYMQATRMDQLYPDPWNNLAVAYSVLGKIDQAIEALKQSLRINPYYPEAYNNLASFLIEKKDLDGAEKMLNVALQLRPHYGKAMYNRGRVWLARAEITQDQKLKNEYNELGWQWYKDACTKADFDTSVLGLQEYARISLMLQKYDDAIYAYGRMLDLNPTLHELVFMIGNAHFMKKDYQQAQHYYQQMIQRIPNDMRAWNNLGEVFYQTQEFKSAIPCFSKAAELNPAILNTQLRLAECCERVGNRGQATSLLKNVLTRNDVPDQTRSVINVALRQLERPPTTA